MDVRSDRRPAPANSARVVSRPHVPAYLWYGFSAVVLGAIEIGVFRMAVWDGTAMMYVPACLLVAFGALLLLVLRNLTSVAIVETGAVELRRFFMPAWRLERWEILSADPTPGITEGPLRLNGFNVPSREIPGFLVRGLRGTWVHDLRDAPLSDIFAGMSREEREAFFKTAHRSTVEGDETYGASPEQRWQNWSRWDKQDRVLNGASFGLTMLSLLFPRYREVWLLDVLIVFVAVGLSVKDRLPGRALRKPVQRAGMVIFSLLPGLLFAAGQFDWQILDPGLGTIALYVAGIIWIVCLTPPWRGMPWREFARYVVLSAVVFGGTAFWANRMLAFANMRFNERTMPIIEVASVLRVEKRPASRSMPANVIVDLGSSPTFGFGLSARFAHYAMPAGPVAVGGQCVLMIRPGLFHVRWVEVAICR